MTKVYTGYRFGSQASDPVRVMVHEEGKKPRQLGRFWRIRFHGDFNWGYSGSGPAQLALALVADVLGEAEATPAVYQRVKTQIVANLPAEGWSLPEGDIRQHVHQIKAYLKKRGKQL